MNARLHNKTPTINALDSRGLPVRQVAYWRCNADDSAQARITSQDHDLAGRVIAQRDPRLFGKFAKANLTTLYSLSGKPLLVDSVDAGWRLNLPGDAGQTLRNWDQRGNHWQTTFDNQLRPITIKEESPGQPARIIERFSYGDSSKDSAALNRCGVLIRHDDEAGTLLIDEYSPGGKPSRQTRHFLLNAESLDWPAEEHSRNLLRETGDGYKTQWHYDATGEVIRQVDAGQHLQRFSFDVAGRLNTVSLKLKDAEIENTLVKDLVYNAFGQVESQTAGNNVISRAVFDPASGRLTSLTASESDRTLQSLHYSHDAVGNVTHIEDKAQPVQFGSNQKVEAVSTFTYDSLYQLTSATGRETAGTTTAPYVPALGITPIDTRQLFNFTQHYTYDAGGNLTELRHVRDRNNYTRTFNVANLNNRLVSWRQGSELPGTATTFDDNGNLQDLQSGQSLQWNALNQLTRVMLLKREDGPDDHERYDYDGSGQRLRKTTTTQGASITHTREVRYLPGIEIRTRGKERLEVITVQAGRGSVRCLHWTEGQPKGIPADQLRYSLDDHLGSSSLELDGKADLISQESYFPFGGTAWTASRSKVEADYRTIRYSGKERDASGLYYYGHRYYAPWLQRWISPDPAGTVDGLNLYCMVGNNPLRFVDHKGLMRDEDLKEFEDWGRARSQEIMDKAKGDFTYRLMPDDFDKRSDYFLDENLLKKEFLAHSYGHIKSSEIGLSDFFNIPKPQGSMRGYRGVDTRYPGDAQTAEHYLQFGTYKISNTAEYLTDVSHRYAAARNNMFHNVITDEDVLKDSPTLSRLADSAHELQQPTRDWIETHIDKMGGIMPMLAGGPGTHAEVRLVNSIVALYPDRAERILSETTVFTDTLSRGDAPQPFPACINCSGILPEGISIPTGRNAPDYAGYNARVQQINQAPLSRRTTGRNRR
ncbi:toxin [Pseudomonas sp. JV414]|uniref:RHS repeat-associated core domain-containing protein n=1 Tax=Pseudomonas sp. JV414 TaxID=1733110 RepID=UPI0028E16924|nr:RHS repeat-associated core domain-containing protein [Pseudomonas sp. JV414]MDT9675178.1 toxin [Pseudomonas sp. JV414]